MKYALTILLLFVQVGTCLAQENAEAFIITIKEGRVRVVSPKKEQKLVSVIVKNETFDKIIAEIRSDKGVIKRLPLKAQDSDSVQVNYSKINSLFYVAIAPPSQTIELKFSQRAYEIPEKK